METHKVRSWPLGLVLFLVFAAVLVLTISTPKKEYRITVMRDYWLSGFEYKSFEIAAPEVEVRVRTDDLRRTTVETVGVRDAAQHRYEKIVIWVPDSYDLCCWQEWLKNPTNLQPAWPCYGPYAN